MVFSSVLFLVYYFIVSLVLYYLCPLKLRNLALFIVNCIFYGWGEPIYISIMFVSIIVDYINGYYVAKYIDTDKKKARRFLLISIIMNLSILGFFKYYDFIMGSINSLLGTNLRLLGLSLPIGISFYTFQTMSYTIDIYRKQAKVQTNIINFGDYVTLFPQLIAGPIVRYQDVADQLDERHISVDQFSDGINRFVSGLAKKVLLANNIGLLWETISASTLSELSVATAWLGAIAYAFQIYFDFSGYSCMAIGLGKMFGFEFLENFNYPYISRSITEFWRRWHISLSTWFKEYVYIPLGGSRVSKSRHLINLMTVWFLTGLWHGASWNFVCWGLYFGVLLILEKFFFKKWLDRHVFISHIYTLVIVLISWILFALTDFSQIIVYIKSMFMLNGNDLFDLQTIVYLRNYIVLLVLCCIAATPIVTSWAKKFFTGKKEFYVVIWNALMLLISLMYIVDASYNPFLYFRF